ncbi:uncharacterized protein I206_107533 [Kwoniella pini CBS 10737]|uniref:SCP domain-containing protein n=1 Tax=Kwoniella pini CBS 10737 TaxID=1296096 RepID=A0A1B9HXI6_9TREE|nr:uncharacterized protein I206_05861 [Kwoniella pini CBS 10737]OCF47995.1 hypothetical protein I206_05861 [Kwoniella pini CBS 10737]
MRSVQIIFLFTLIIPLLLSSSLAHPHSKIQGRRSRSIHKRKHSNRQRRSECKSSTSSSNDNTADPDTQSTSGIEAVSLGLWTPFQKSTSGNDDAAAIGSTPDSEAGSEGYGGTGSGKKAKGGWGGWGGWNGGGDSDDSSSEQASDSQPADAISGEYDTSVGYSPSQQLPTISSSPLEGDSTPDTDASSAAIDVSILKAGGQGGYTYQAAQPTSSISEYQSQSYQKPTIYSTNYVEVTEWYTPPISSSSYQAPASSYEVPAPSNQASSYSQSAGQTEVGAIPTTQPYVPTPTSSDFPSITTGFSQSTAGGYSSSQITTEENGQQVQTSSWHSSWANTWSNPGVTSTSQENPVATSAPDNDDAKTFIDCHNQYRNQYGAGNVSWGDELASYASQHASICASMTHTNGPYGENLAAGTEGFLNIISSIDMWMDEASSYDASNPTYSHFTQVVWKETTSIGCAAINCDANTGMAGQLYVMCEYHPRGNIVGAFAQNVGKR